MSFRVTGMFMGKQVRKNYPTLAEAETFKRASLAKATQVETVQLVSTRLHQADMPRIETWVAKLGSVDRLGEAVAFFERHSAPPVSYSPAEAVEAYAASRRGRGVGSRAERKGADSVEVMKSILTKMLREVNPVTLHDLSADRLRPWVYDESVGTRTRRDRHSWLTGLFIWLKKVKAWAGDSPMDAIERPMHRPGLPAILPLDRVQKLVNLAATDTYADFGDPAEKQEPTGRPGVMLTYFAVCLFTGIRPEEAQKLGRGRPVDPSKPDGERTSGWEFVHFENRLIELPPDMVKVGGVRNVPLAEGVLAILAEAKRRGLPFCFFSKRVFNRVRKDAGVMAGWEPDVMRHCYASYNYIVHQDVKALESAMGNSRTILFKHYIRRTVTATEGAAYETLVPPGWPPPVSPSSRQRKPRRSQP